MSGLMLAVVGGNYNNAAAAPTVIGQAYGGGFYAGKISTTMNGVATHYLVVAPKASGENASIACGNTDSTFASSLTDGATNTDTLVTLTPAKPAAVFCRNLTIGGYNDWYMPAREELKVLYFYLKPTTEANKTSVGSNSLSVSPQPSTNYTTGNPAQTTAINFKTGETEALGSTTQYWTSSEDSAYRPANYAVFLSNGNQGTYVKTTLLPVRAVRKVPII